VKLRRTHMSGQERRRGGDKGGRGREERAHHRTARTSEKRGSGALPPPVRALGGGRGGESKRTALKWERGGKTDFLLKENLHFYIVFINPLQFFFFFFFTQTCSRDFFEGGEIQNRL
jgi:hypothetical protein